MPNDLGRNFTVEDCQRLPIEGLIKSFKTKSADAILGAKVMVSQIRIHLTSTQTRFSGVRFWFLCPQQCGRRIGVLLIHPTGKVGCRNCLGVKYRQQRFKGMIEGESFAAA